MEYDHPVSVHFITDPRTGQQLGHHVINCTLVHVHRDFLIQVNVVIANQKRIISLLPDYFNGFFQSNVICFDTELLVLFLR